MIPVWKLLASIFGLVGIGTVVFVLCSGDRREQVADGIVSIGHAFTGATGEPGEREPKVIRKAKEKEQWRQSNTWTAENISKEPHLFLREKLDDLARLQENLEAQLRAQNMKLAGIQVQERKFQAQVASAEAFIRKGMEAYDVAEKTGAWPTTVNGHSVDQEQLQRLICEAEHRKTLAKTQAQRMSTARAKIRATIFKIQREALPQVDAMRQQAEMNVEALKAKRVMDDVDDVGATLEALQAQMNGFDVGGFSGDSVSLEEIMQPSEEQIAKEDFERIRKAYTQPAETATP